MLALTKRTEYALIALCHLAREPQAVVSAREIGQRYAVPLPLLMKVLKELQRAGLVASTRGARGGYRLAAPPERITLRTVVEALEGPARLVQCVLPERPSEGRCDLLGSCPIRQPVSKLHEKFDRFLAEVTIAELAFDEGFGSPLLAEATLRVRTP